MIFAVLQKGEIMNNDTISRQAVIDAFVMGNELLRRMLDDTDVVGVERAKYEWGLGLIEAYIADMKALPSAQPDVIRCKDCKFRDKGYRRIAVKWLPCMEMRTGSNWFCGSAKRWEE